ncbi:VOC family protein [Virgibacillus necropolis]|uniref:VOC family protein n=1 Tax=Virgibacillus necropolis TaxID=163877 RepID=UPI003850330E
MTRQFWINLPVKDIDKSKDFFAKLGFSVNKQNSNQAALVIGDKNAPVMLFQELAFKNIIRNEIVDTNQASEVLLSIDAASKEEVDELTKKVVNAGGSIFEEPAEHHGWMYGCGFADLDGHRWNVLYMDMSKMPKD